MATILVVDDDEIIRSILEDILTGAGHTVVQASDGDACIKAARDAAPDVILLDMNMPKMTGFEVAPVLRSHPATKSIPIVALTADASTQSMEAAHDAGCDNYLAKPLKSDSILNLVNRLIGT